MWCGAQGPSLLIQTINKCVCDHLTWDGLFKSLLWNLWPSFLSRPLGPVPLLWDFILHPSSSPEDPGCCLSIFQCWYLEFQLYFIWLDQPIVFVLSTLKLMSVKTTHRIQMCLLLAKWGSPPDQKQFYEWVCLFFFFSLFLFLWKLPMGLKHNNTLWERKGESGWFLVSPEGPSLLRSPYRQAKHSEKVGLPKLETAWGALAFSVTTFWPWNHPVTPLSLSVLPSSPTAWLLGGRGGTLCDKCPCWRYGTLPCSAARACACLCLFILFVSTAFFFNLNEIWTFLCPAFLSCLPS